MAFTVGATAGGGPPVWWIVVAAAALVLLLALLVAVVLLVRRRRRSPVASVLVLLLLLLVGGSLAAGRPAYADYQVDPNQGSNPAPDVNFKDQVDACLGRFAAPGGAPACILPRLKDPKTPKVTIIPTMGGSAAADTGASKNGKGSSTVAWNYGPGRRSTSTRSHQPCATRARRTD